MPATALQVLRIAAVVALVCAAAALVTPPGRLPLAVRGVARLFGVEPSGETEVPAWKKVVAFVLVLVAVGLCVVG